MTSFIARFATILAVAMLSACGTISDIKPTNVTERADFSKYSKVSVLDFRNAVPLDDIKPEERSSYKEQVDIAARNFADRIAAEIRKSNTFANVTRDAVDGAEDAVVVTGQITRYVEGNAFLRFFIGMGAGSSYFDASIDFIDNKTKTKVGTITADKNSWALGGGIAAGQTVEKMMQAAAEKTAEELSNHHAHSTTP